jgi:phage N-6-adenine-methyltransferase
MSIVGFRSRNNPEQVKVRGAIDVVDERITPDDLYESFNARFQFTIDVAANANNAKTAAFFDLVRSGLLWSWAPSRVWCNPPYSNCAAWLHKAHKEFEAGCPVICMLLPANRTEQKWWQQFVEPYRDRGGFLTTEFIPRRRNFGVPGNEGANWKKGVPFGLVAVIFKQQSGR